MNDSFERWELDGYPLSSGNTWSPSGGPGRGGPGIWFGGGSAAPSWAVPGKLPMVRWTDSSAGPQANTKRMTEVDSIS